MKAQKSGSQDDDSVLQNSWEWSQVPSLPGSHPSARDFARMTALPGGIILLFGGLDANERRLDDAWVFDTARFTPHPSPPLPSPIHISCGLNRFNSACILSNCVKSSLRRMISSLEIKTSVWKHLEDGTVHGIETGP